MISPLSRITRLVAAFALLSPWVGSCADDDDTGPDGWTDDSCADYCEELFAEDLDESPISWYGYQLVEDQCECTFLPCETSMCTAWCIENEGLDQGICQLLECECIEGT